MSDDKRWDIPGTLVDPSKGQKNMDPIFPGQDGLPFRGIVPDLKKDDPEHLQPKQGCRVHVEILNMSRSKDRERMEKIYSMYANGTAIISDEERQWIPERRTWRVFLRWADVYMYNPARGV